MTMESERSEQSRSTKAARSSGKERSETIGHMQEDLLDAYEQSSRAWLARVKSEVDLWSELAAKLSATRSMPEALDSYQRFVMQRMEMAAQDGKQLVEDCQDIARKMTKSLSSGWPTGSS